MEGEGGAREKTVVVGEISSYVRIKGNTRFFFFSPFLQEEVVRLQGLNAELTSSLSESEGRARRRAEEEAEKM